MGGGGMQRSGCDQLAPKVCMGKMARFIDLRVLT